MTTSGFVGPPPPVTGVWADTQAEAWRIYRESPEEFGYPLQVGERWLVPRPVRVVDARLAAEAAAVHDAYRQAAAEGAGTAEQRTEVRPAGSRRAEGPAARRERASEKGQPPGAVRQAAFF